VIVNIVKTGRVFSALLVRDLYLLKSGLFDNLIDSSIIVGISYVLYGKLLPSMGSNPALVTPTFFGIVAVILVNLSYDRTMSDAIDFDTQQTLLYQVLTPIPASLLPLKFIISYVIDIVIATAPVVVLGFIVYGPLLVMERGNLLLFAIVYLLGSAFMSTLLLTVATAKSFTWFAYRTWPFILLPMTTLGCFYYPLHAVEQVLPWLGHIIRWIPTTSIVEGMRGSMISADAYMPVSECIIRLACYTVLCYPLLARSMQRRFDLVKS
jgi:ABC-type multidrug transport system permease subunit